MTKKEVIVPADGLVCLGKDKLQELIRCKDCYWFIESEVFKGKDCTHFSGLTYPGPDDYCSYGERKEE